MKRFVKIIGVALCLLLALSFVAGLVFPELLAFVVERIPAFARGDADAFLYWGATIGWMVILAGLAFWALLKFQRTPQKRQRAVFLLIAVIIVLMFATEIATRMTPAYGATLRGPVQAALGYALAIAVSLGFIIDARARRA